MKKLLSLCIVISLWTNVNAQIQQDKVNHFFAGGMISYGTSLVAYKVTHNKIKSILIGLGTGFAAGAAKEIYDSTGRGFYEVKDFLWTCIGSSMSSVSVCIIIE